MEWKLFWRYALDLSVLFPAAFLCLAPVWEFLPAPRRTLGAAAAFLLGGTLGAAALCARFRLDSNDLLLPLALLAFLLYLRALRGALSIWRAAFSFFSACFLLVVCSVLSVLLNARAELASSAPVCQASTALLCLGLAALVCLLSALTAVPWTRWLLQEYESEGIWRAIWLLPAGYTGIYLLSMPRFPQETELLLLDRVQEISVLTCLLPLGVYLLFLYLFYVIGRESARNLRLTEENHVLAVESHRYEQLRNYLEKTRTLRHDFRQHLRVISGLSEAGELEELRAYLRQCSGELAEERVTLCASPAVDAIAAALIFRALGRGKNAMLVSGIVGEVIMVLGYFAYASTILGKGLAAAASIPGNIVQGVAGIAIGMVLAVVLESTKVTKKAGLGL